MGLEGLAGLDWSALGNEIEKANQPAPVPKTNFTSDLFDSPKSQGSWSQVDASDEFQPPPRQTVSTPLTWDQPDYNPIEWPTGTPSYNPQPSTPLGWPKTTPTWNPIGWPTGSYPPTSTPWQPSAPAPKPQAPGGKTPTPQQPAPQQQTPDLKPLSQSMSMLVAPQQSVIVGGARGQPLPFQADRAFRGKDPAIANDHNQNFLNMLRAGFASAGWHQNLLVPIHHCHRGVKGVEVGESCLELGQAGGLRGGCGHA